MGGELDHAKLIRGCHPLYPRAKPRVCHESLCPPKHHRLPPSALRLPNCLVSLQKCLPRNSAVSPRCDLPFQWLTLENDHATAGELSLRKSYAWKQLRIRGSR